VANELRAKHGNDVLVKRALARIEQDNVGCAVIESIRTLAEAETLRAAGGVLLAIDAEPKERYRRISGRKSATDNISYETFLAQEAIEMNETNPHGMQKAAVMAGADYTIMNNGSLRTLWQKMNSFMRIYDTRQ
jgi:dephospho-CoA kinase